MDAQEYDAETLRQNHDDFEATAAETLAHVDDDYDWDREHENERRLEREQGWD